MPVNESVGIAQVWPFFLKTFSNSPQRLVDYFFLLTLVDAKSADRVIHAIDAVLQSNLLRTCHLQRDVHRSPNLIVGNFERTDLVVCVVTLPAIAAASFGAIAAENGELIFLMSRTFVGDARRHSL